MQQEIQDNTVKQISFSKTGERKVLLDILSHEIRQLRSARGELRLRGRENDGVKMCLGSNSSNEGIGENSKIGPQIRANHCLPQLESHMDPVWTVLAV